MSSQFICYLVSTAVITMILANNRLTSAIRGVCVSVGALCHLFHFYYIFLLQLDK